MTPTMNGTLLGLASLAVAAANGAVFVSRMQRVALTGRLFAHDLGWAASLALGIAAFASGAGWLGGIAAGLGVAVGGVMGFVRLGSAQTHNAPAVSVGTKILDFTAPDENGEPFSLASLAGQPLLLKFFRGHW